MSGSGSCGLGFVNPMIPPAPKGCFMVSSIPTSRQNGLKGRVGGTTFLLKFLHLLMVPHLF